MFAWGSWVRQTVTTGFRVRLWVTCCQLTWRLGSAMCTTNESIKHACHEAPIRTLNCGWGLPRLATLYGYRQILCEDSKLSDSAGRGHRSSSPGIYHFFPWLMLVTLYPSLLETLTMSFIDVSKLWVILANYETFGSCGNPSTCNWYQRAEGLGDCSFEPCRDPPLPTTPSGAPTKTKAKFFTVAFKSHTIWPCCISTFIYIAPPSLTLLQSCQPLAILCTLHIYPPQHLFTTSFFWLECPTPHPTPNSS